MTQADLTQQLVRIALYILTPLLLKWGIDQGNATIIITSGATLAGTLGWWLYWHLKQSSPPKT